MTAKMQLEVSATEATDGDSLACSTRFTTPEPGAFFLTLIAPNVRNSGFEPSSPARFQANASVTLQQVYASIS